MFEFTEYPYPRMVYGSWPQAEPGAENATQQIEIGATSAQSAAFNARTNLIRVTVAGEWTRVFPIDPDAPAEIAWDLDLTVRPLWRTDGTVGLNCTSGGGTPAPQVFQREYWMFPSEEDDPGLFSYDEWAEHGGELVSTELVVPDLDEPHSFAAFVALPGVTEPVWVVVVDRFATSLTSDVGVEIGPGFDEGWGWGIGEDVPCDA